jgi:hypothetical protein
VEGGLRVYVEAIETPPPESTEEPDFVRIDVTGLSMFVVIGLSGGLPLVSTSDVVWLGLLVFSGVGFCLMFLVWLVGLVLLLGLLWRGLGLLFMVWLGGCFWLLGLGVVVVSARLGVVVLEVSVVRVRGRGLGVRVLDPGDGSSIVLYPNQVRWLCARRLLAGIVCSRALQALKLVSVQGED